MPTYTFLDLVTAVKEEGRVDRGNDLDAMIKRIINEIMVKHCRNKEFPDLFTPNTAITIPSNGIDHFALPADFAKVNQVVFSTNSGTNFVRLKKKNVYSLPYLTGFPQWWYTAGSQLYLYPYTEIVTGGTHVLRIDYYKLPVLLVGDTDPLTIDDLYPVIINETLSRVRRYHQDETGAQAFKKDSQDAMTTAQDD